MVIIKTINILITNILMLLRTVSWKFWKEWTNTCLGPKPNCIWTTWIIQNWLIVYYIEIAARKNRKYRLSRQPPVDFIQKIIDTGTTNFYSDLMQDCINKTIDRNWYSNTLVGSVQCFLYRTNKYCLAINWNNVRGWDNAVIDRQ